MKATDLNQALNYVDDVYLRELDTPEKELRTMKNRKKTVAILIAAAMISLLSMTAYAAEVLNIFSLESGRSKYYERYSDAGQAMKRAGLELDIPEQFANGFQFQRVEVQEVKGRDENGKKVLTFQELNVHYNNSAGQRLLLCIHPHMDEIEKTKSIPAERKTMDGIEMRYYLDHYRFVPADYELSEEELEWSEQPGNYVSYGSDEVRESDVAFLQWTKGDVTYFFMDHIAVVSPDTLFAMAEEMINTNS